MSGQQFLGTFSNPSRSQSKLNVAGGINFKQNLQTYSAAVSASGGSQTHRVKPKNFIELNKNKAFQFSSKNNKVNKTADDNAMKENSM